MNIPIFKAVDDYLNQLFSLEDVVLKETLDSIDAMHNMPAHSVSANQGQFLLLLAKLCNARTIIEVGTLGGYSTIWLARALEGKGKVYSIEVVPEYAAIARQNIAKAQLESVVDIRVGDALQVLDGLDLGSAPVDLFFMDADKPNYVNYFNWALKNARTGSLIIADNVVRDGKVIDPAATDEKVIGVRNYLEMLAQRKDVVSSVLQQVGEKDYDGIAISWVK